MSSARAAPLPANVAVRPRDAVRRGITLGRLRGPDYQRLSRGLYAATVAARDMRSLARMTADVLPCESGYGHLTAAFLRDWWLPNRFPLSQPVLFASTRSGVHAQRRGLYVRRSAYTRVEHLDGIPVVSAAETLLELAGDLSLIDLVPMLDCALGRGADPAEILAAARPRSRGSRNLRRALRLADPKSESWWESVLRLLHVLTNLGPIASQVEIRVDGALVARADLHLLGTSRYPECDGGEHRTRERHEQDLAREKAIGRLRLERYGYTTSEIAGQPEMIIRDAEDARGLGHDPRRSARWWGYARPSSLTAYGRTRLLARLQRYRRAANR